MTTDIDPNAIVTETPPTPPDFGAPVDDDESPRSSGVNPRISPAVRAMIAEAAKRTRTGGVSAGDLAAFDPDNEEPAPIVETRATRVATPAPKAEPIVATPVPDAAAEAIKRWDAAAERQKALDDREAALRDREAKYGDMSERLAADPLALVRDLAKQRLGAGATETEIDGEVGYLLTDMSMKLAKVEDDPNDVKAQLRKIQRELKQSKIEERRAADRTAAAEKARTEERAKADQSQRAEASYRGALTTVKREFTADADVSGNAIVPLATSCPFLALEDGYEEKIFQLIKDDHDEQVASGATVEVMSIAAAAKHLEDALAARDRERFTKRRHLLQPEAATQKQPRSEHQGDQPRRSRPLTQADASEDSPPPEKVYRTPAQAIADTVRRMRPELQKVREAATPD